MCRCYSMGTVRYPSLKRSRKCVFIVFILLFLRSGYHKVYRYAFCCVSLLGSCNNGIFRVIRCILLPRKSPQKFYLFLIVAPVGSRSRHRLSRLMFSFAFLSPASKIVAKYSKIRLWPLFYAYLPVNYSSVYYLVLPY